MWQLILVSLGLGVGLAMDACAVSMSNGMNEPNMKTGKAMGVAALFGIFQGVMPMIGWLCVSLIVEQFAKFELWIPYIALALLAIIGAKMIYDGAKDKKEQEKPAKLTIAVLFVQAVATSIDALSTGFGLADIAGDVWWMALVSSCIIAVMTFALSLGGVYLGKRFGMRLGDKAQIVGGCVLIGIGLEIFITGVFF